MTHTECKNLVLRLNEFYDDRDITMVLTHAHNRGYGIERFLQFVEIETDRNYREGEVVYPLLCYLDLYGLQPKLPDWED